MNSGFKVLEKSVSKSFDKIADSSPSPSTVDDVELYESLSPEALNVIAETYGPDKLLEYVTAMEVRRSKKGF